MLSVLQNIHTHSLAQYWGKVFFCFLLCLNFEAWNLLKNAINNESAASEGRENKEIENGSTLIWIRCDWIVFLLLDSKKKISFNKRYKKILENIQSMKAERYMKFYLNIVCSFILCSNERRWFSFWIGFSLLFSIAMNVHQ